MDFKSDHNPGDLITYSWGGIKREGLVGKVSIEAILIDMDDPSKGFKTSVSYGLVRKDLPGTTVSEDRLKTISTDKEPLSIIDQLKARLDGKEIPTSLPVMSKGKPKNLRNSAEDTEFTVIETNDQSFDHTFNG